MPYAMLFAAPALAQQTPQPPAQNEGLSISVSAESEWEDLGIAIPVFATDAGVPTSTSAGSTGALGQAPEFQVWSGRSTAPCWSPAGSKIVFESDRSGSQQVYVESADGSNRSAQLLRWPRADNFCVAVMSPGGGELRHLIDIWRDEAPSWSPNGRIIQFFWTEHNSGKVSIWQVDSTGRNECRLPTPAMLPIRPGGRFCCERAGEATCARQAGAVVQGE